MSLLAEAASIILNGLQQGAIYVLVAMGLSIILGTLKFVNFAHGALYLIGTYAGMLIALEIHVGGKLREWGFTTLGLGWGFIAALFIVPVLVFAIGMLMERFIARPFYDRPDTDQILLTFGIAIVLQEAFRTLFGGRSYSFDLPATVSIPVQVPLIGSYPLWRLILIGITVVLVVLVYLLIEFTDFGLIVRAGTADAEMVRLLGIKITRPYLVVFGIGAALAGVAGVVGGPLYAVNPNIGMEVLVPAFLVVVIGGVGSLTGAVIGGVLLGLTQAFLTQFVLVTPWFSYSFSPWAQVGIYLIAAVILLTRPEGLMGSAEVGA